MKLLALLFLSLLSVARAGDITVEWDETVTTVPASRKAEAESARSLVDWLVVSNNMPPGYDVLTYQIIPAHLGAGAGFARTIISGYTYNLHGKLVANPEYIVRIYYNLDDGFMGSSKAYFQASLFHELFHALGFDAGPWWFNGYVGGTVPIPGNQYTGPALTTYQEEYDPFAAFIPVDFSHFAESMDPDEIMTPGLSNGGILNAYVSATMLAVVADNGWTVREGFTGGLLIDLLPKRRLPDEDPFNPLP
jgi:hypothetical protein